jgi:hypothetical protein
MGADHRLDPGQWTVPAGLLGVAAAASRPRPAPANHEPLLVADRRDGVKAQARETVSELSSICRHDPGRAPWRVLEYD